MRPEQIKRYSREYTIKIESKKLIGRIILMDKQIDNAHQAHVCQELFLSRPLSGREARNI